MIYIGSIWSQDLNSRSLVDQSPLITTKITHKY